MAVFSSRFFWFFLGAYVLHEGLLIILDLLNYFHTEKQDQPPAFYRDRISPATHARAKAYALDKLRFSLFANVMQIPFFWLLVFWGGFNALDYYAIALADYGSLTRSVLFCVFVAAYFAVVALPFRVYGVFVIEERHGFNKTTPALFAADLVKTLLLSLALGVPLLYAVFWFARVTGESWWLFAWLVFAGFQFFLAAVYPVWLAPLFNKFTPLGDEPLKKRIEEIAAKTGFRMDGVYTIDGSKRSGHSNAYFAGLGRHRRIVLFDTLIRQMEREELVAVLAHEMGHSVKRHVAQSVVLSGILSFAGLFVLSRLTAWPEFYRAFNVTLPSLHAALAVFVLVSDSFTFAVTPLLNLWSRKNEYEADRFAAELVGGAPLKRALLKLTEENLSNLSPHPAYCFYHHSHPTAEERLKALNSVATG